MWDYHFGDSGSASWKTSSMKVRADRWVSAGIAIEEETITGDKDTKVVATTELFNNSPHKATISKEISAAVEESTSEDWSIEAGVATKGGFEAGPENFKVTGEVEVSHIRLGMARARLR